MLRKVGPRKGSVAPRCPLLYHVPVHLTKHGGAVWGQVALLEARLSGKAEQSEPPNSTECPRTNHLARPGLQKSSLLLNVSSNDYVFTTLTESSSVVSLQTTPSRTASRTLRALPASTKSPALARATSPLSLRQKPLEPTKSSLRSVENLSEDLTPLQCRVEDSSPQRSSPSQKGNSSIDKIQAALSNCADAGLESPERQARERRKVSSGKIQAALSNCADAGLESPQRQARERRKVEVAVRMNELKAIARERKVSGEGTGDHFARDGRHAASDHNKELKRQNDLDQVTSCMPLCISLSLSPRLWWDAPRDQGSRGDAVLTCQRYLQSEMLRLFAEAKAIGLVVETSPPDTPGSEQSPTSSQHTEEQFQNSQVVICRCC